MPSYVSVVFNVPIDKAFTYRVPEGSEPARPGTRVEAPFGARSATGWVLGGAAEPEGTSFEVKEYRRIVDAEPLFGEETVALARWVAGMYFCPLGEALAAMLPSGRRETEPPTAAFDDFCVESEAISLSDEQRRALEAVVSRPSGRWYLFGATGSGKTEVFLQAAESTLAEGRSVLYLVPEIALTHQVVEAVTRRFGQRCAVLHSGLTPSQKLSEWRRLLRGEADIAVGARSAAFAPLRALGLIVVDEEHESSYKAGSSPRYHARQVAMRRAGAEGARLLMGSATPSLESYALMKEGVLESLELTGRLSGGELPSVEVVDMRGEERSISKPLADAVRAAKASGGQSILFLNRRGFSHFWSCRSCGEGLKCRNCSVGLTFHKDRNRLVCHYCGWSLPPPSVCPSCGSLDMGSSGFGTERVEEDATGMFPGFTVARLDADSAAKKGAVESALASFRKGETDILLGTQMVAKGLNFPGVKTVGVILADTSLNLPDFRASERAFALIVQVSGRAGRFSRDGRVFVQTFRPDDPVVRFARTHDVRGFYDHELAIRAELGFPPFSRLIRLVFRSKDKSRALAFASETAASLAPIMPDGAEILGPAECPVFTVSGNARYQVILKSDTRGHAASFGSLRAALAAVLADGKAPYGCYLEIDVDPVSLL